VQIGLLGSLVTGAFLLLPLGPVTPRPGERTATLSAGQVGFDVGRVVETVSHHVGPARGDPSMLASEDRLYRAEFGATGFSLTLPRGLSTYGRAPAFRIETVGVVRGGKRFAVPPARWRGQRNSALRALAPDLTERVTARAGALDWDYLVERHPAGGALTIDARVSSAGAAVASGAGSTRAWRFPAGAGRSVTVGSLVVRDARDRELYTGLPTYARGRLALTVPARVLYRAAYPLTIDPVITPEYPVSDPVNGSLRGSQNEAAVGFDGTNYLVVWADSRSSGATDIYGARVSPAGTVLDVAGIAISTAPGAQQSPAVAFDGTNYLVGWQDNRTDSDYEVYAARVSRAGAVLDPGGIGVSTGHFDGAPKLAFDGTNYLLAWTDGRSSSFDVYGARVSRAGTVLDPGGIAISTATSDQQPEALAFDGSNYLVVWRDRRSGTNSDIYAARVSPAGNVLDPAGIPISTAPNDQLFPTVAFDGTNSLVAWHDYRSGSGDIYGARVSRGGTVLDPTGIPISTATGTQIYPAAAFDGTRYLVVWEDRRSGSDHVYGARVTPGGTVVDPGGIAITMGDLNQSFPAVAFDGTNYLVAFTTFGDTSDLQCARVSPGGSVLDPDGINITKGINEQWSPAVAFDGTNYFVVWQDARTPSYDVYGARVTPSGAILDGGGIAIARGGRSQLAPAVAFDGSDYLVAWSELRANEGGNYDIYGARVSPAGTVLDPAGIGISTASGTQAAPAVTSGGGNSLVVWEDGRNKGQIFAARVTAGGTVLDPNGIELSPANGFALSPAAAFDGGNYLVAWSDTRTFTTFDIYGARVTQSGTVLDPDGFPISTEDSTQERPAIAFDGANYLVAWDDLRSGPHSDIYGARVSPAGTVLDPTGIAVSTAANDQASPVVAFDGATYLVAWQDSRAGSSDIYAARVTRAGVVRDGNGIVITATAADERSPTAVRGPSGGRIAVAYQRYAAESPYGGVRRAFLRFVYQPSVSRRP